MSPTSDKAQSAGAAAVSGVIGNATYAALGIMLTALTGSCVAAWTIVKPQWPLALALSGIVLSFGGLLSMGVIVALRAFVVSGHLLKAVAKLEASVSRSVADLEASVSRSVADLEASVSRSSTATTDATTKMLDAATRVSDAADKANKAATDAITNAEATQKQIISLGIAVGAASNKILEAAQLADAAAGKDAAAKFMGDYFGLLKGMMPK